MGTAVAVDNVAVDSVDANAAADSVRVVTNCGNAADGGGVAGDGIGDGEDTS